MLFAGEDGLENIDPNEQARQRRRERNAAMTEEDKEKHVQKLAKIIIRISQKTWLYPYLIQVKLSVLFLIH